VGRGIANESCEFGGREIRDREQMAGSKWRGLGRGLRRVKSHGLSHGLTLQGRAEGSHWEGVRHDERVELQGREIALEDKIING
jgi:hypothetical protein